jgi:hypothetical protein
MTGLPKIADKHWMADLTALHFCHRDLRSRWRFGT